MRTYRWWEWTPPTNHSAKEFLHRGAIFHPLNEDEC
jgi:hypothetical protein